MNKQPNYEKKKERKKERKTVDFLTAFEERSSFQLSGVEDRRESFSRGCYESKTKSKMSPDER